jgi:hypothetical protein
MGYYNIKEHKVFVTKEIDRELWNEVTKDKSALYRISSRIKDSPESIEVDKLIYELIMSEYQNDPDNFIENWVKFDLTDVEAQSNIWDLLFDYCLDKPNFFLENIKYISLQDGQYNINNEIYKPFYICVEYDVSKWWEKLFLKNKTIKTTCFIDTKKIKRINGSLDQFVVFSDDYTVFCHNKIGISLFPPNIDLEKLNLLMLQRFTINM